MSDRKQLRERHVIIHGALPSLVRRKLSWKILAVLLVLMVLPALAVHFFDRIEYQNDLNQQQQQYGALQNQANQQQLDLKHLIDITPSQLNCLQLQADAAKQLCQKHDVRVRL